MKVSQRLYIFKFVTAVLCAVMLFSSCVVDSTGSKEKSQGGISERDDETTSSACQNYYDFDNDICLSTRCNDFTHEGTEEELTAKATEITNSNLSDADKETLLTQLNEATAVCLAGSGVLRPDQEVYINGKNLCVCKNGKPHILKECEATCNGKPNTVNAVLYGVTTLSSNVLINFGSLDGWCNNEITNSSNSGPSCSLKITSEDGSSDDLTVAVAANSNNFSATVEPSLTIDTNYIISIKENASGSESVAEQIRLAEYIDPDLNPNLGPLAWTPITRYACLFRSAEVSNNIPSFISYARQHYYFTEQEKPVHILPNRPLIRCHEGFTDGGGSKDNDDPLYERLSQESVSFALWSNNDSRLRDKDLDGQVDLNLEIVTEYETLTGQSNSGDRFFPFSWRIRPPDGHPSAALEASLGFILRPYVVESENFRGECPTQAHFQSSNTEYQLLGEYIQTDTEGIYMAESDAFVSEVVGADGTSTEDIITDVMLIKESDLKAIDFYEENGQRFPPNELGIGNKTIHFFFPFDKTTPLLKKDYQKRYTIKFPDEINRDDTTVDDGIKEGIEPSDKRFGCIPKI